MRSSLVVPIVFVNHLASGTSFARLQIGAFRTLLSAGDSHLVFVAASNCHRVFTIGQLGRGQLCDTTYMATKTIPEYLEDERRSREGTQLLTDEEAARIQSLHPGHHRTRKSPEQELQAPVEVVVKVKKLAVARARKSAEGKARKPPMAKARKPVAAKARKSVAAKPTKPAGAARRKPTAARKTGTKARRVG